MSLHVDFDGTVTLTDDSDPNRTQVLSAPTNPAEEAANEAAIVAFFGPPPRRLIPKEIVEARLQSIGKLELAFAALSSDPVKQLQWLARNWPNVYHDDEGLLTVLAAIGCTSEEIAAVTA